ncbi:FIG002776: hypothetical protein [hydrothermal vent metagenome]|uniref:JmjC domain-containing protein n=1 Tax=hydrothermal vent metagenome TaxID=652676 RepID=A0A3B0Y3K0_9ZZZZ
MSSLPNPLGNLSPEDFLNEYWQKKTRVFRQAFPGFQCPINAEELAGLSCEEDVNARIIIEKDGDHPWQPVFGPMDDEVFANLPESHWTLVINDLEKLIPELAWMPDLFDFIPNWRFDDLMTSYAADQGSVGPHFDLYDVFIIQGKGRRRWQISTADVRSDNQVNGTPLRIQQTFKAEEEWILEPGDMIYIPPNVSHHGVSLGESISFSVGYRAVSHADLLNDFIAHITQNLPANFTYQDADLKTQVQSAEITEDAIKRIKNIFKEYLKPDHPQISRWFGRYMSDPKTELAQAAEKPLKSIDELTTELENGNTLSRHPASRFAYIKENAESMLFINGADYSVSANFAEALCKNRQLNKELITTASTEEQQLIVELYNAGNLYIE